MCISRVDGESSEGGPDQLSAVESVDLRQTDCFVGTLNPCTKRVDMIAKGNLKRPAKLAKSCRCLGDGAVGIQSLVRRGIFDRFFEVGQEVFESIALVANLVRPFVVAVGCTPGVFQSQLGFAKFSSCLRTYDRT